MEDLLQWLKNKHQKLEEKMKVLFGDEISFAELNKRMANYGSDYAWAIAEDSIAEEVYRKKKLAFDQWLDRLLAIAKTEDPKQAVKALQAIIAAENKEEWIKWKHELLQLELRKNARSMFIKVWGNMKDIYIELARNMRADYQSSGGVSIGETGKQRVAKIKRIRRLSNESEKA